MARRIRVGVIFGGRSGEHDVSLRSAQAIMRAMDRNRFEVVPIGITREGRWLIGPDPLRELAGTSQLALEDGSGDTPVEDPGFSELATRSEAALDVADAGWVRDLDVVFPALHGPMGEDGTIQGMFELADIPYVGAGVLASSVAMDKVTAKRLFLQAGLPVDPAWLCVTRREWQQQPEEITARIEREIGYPCFTKPVNLGSSVGVAKVHHPGELEAGMAEAARHDRRILVERGIDARELEVSVLGNDDPIASVVGEIVPAREFYDYEAKYVDDSELLVPAPITEQQSEAIRRAARDAFSLLDCAGLARVDFFLERSTGRIFLNEVNTIPGFTRISMYPKLWEASGLTFQDLVSRLVELAVERYADRHGGG
ncbi:MAG TPA: D-alanine--D-alanine ligase family protein [Thermomicrobiaceae bacterium]|nr:D-alanine--D-alanine ligase family protein [Thermomicrobiaceae bacterium]